MFKILFAKGVMHHNGNTNEFGAFVEFDETNLMETSAGFRYKCGSLWYLITDDTEFVYA